MRSFNGSLFLIGRLYSVVWGAFADVKVYVGELEVVNCVQSENVRNGLERDPSGTTCPAGSVHLVIPSFLPTSLSL